MTAGVMIFAHNNTQINYVAMAAWSAKNIRRHLALPVCLVTDSDSLGQHAKDFEMILYNNTEQTNTRHFSDVGNVIWQNMDRIDAYRLSPWHTTLVLDADYVVASDQLLLLFKCHEEFLCHRRALDATGLKHFEDLNYFGKNCFPMWWATVMLFRKTRRCEIIFESMRMIKTHWPHYRALYGITRATYRNDHALSIALNIENGHTLDTTDIPWDLNTVTPDHRLTQIDQDRYRIDFRTPDQKLRWIELEHDFHAMGKQQLGDIVAST